MSPIHDSTTFPKGSYLPEYEYPDTAVDANDNVYSILLKSSTKYAISECAFFSSEEYRNMKPTKHGK